VLPSQFVDLDVDLHIMKKMNKKSVNPFVCIFFQKIRENDERVNFMSSCVTPGIKFTRLSFLRTF